MALVEPPDPNANSYCSTAFGHTYFADLPGTTNAAWVDAASDLDRGTALIAATRMLESYAWAGQKTHVVATNALRWPRSGVYNADAELLNSTNVPAAIKQATCELARSLLAGDIDNSGNSTAGSTSQTISQIAVEGAIDISYNTSVEAAKAFIAPTANVVDALIQPYLLKGASGASVRLIRG